MWCRSERRTELEPDKTGTEVLTPPRAVEPGQYDAIPAVWFLNPTIRDEAILRYMFISALRREGPRRCAFFLGMIECTQLGRSGRRSDRSAA
jgi:hypothetical protein